MIRRSEAEADIIRLIVTTREKFPHTVAWDAALKRVIWRYTTPEKPKPKRRRGPSQKRKPSRQEAK